MDNIQNSNTVGSSSFHIKNILSLTIITTVVTFALLYVYYVTYVPPNPIKDVEMVLGKASVSGAYKMTAQQFSEESGVTNIVSKEYWVVNQDETEIMRVFKVNAGGFGGAVVTLVGIDGEEVKVVHVLDASGETAGLGQRVMEHKFSRQFFGKKKQEIPTDRTEWTNNLEMISSATFSSGAVARNITQAFNLYRISKEGGQ